MKGIVFTEFLELVESAFSFEIADQIVEESDLQSGGAYTSVGTYDYQELVQLVIKLSEKTETDIPVLLRIFGKHLFGRFVDGYPSFFENVDSMFSFLENVEDYVHVEVRKLYPDAELPTFECERPDSEKLIMVYQSRRALHDFAEGLIVGCADHFAEKVDIQKEDLSNGEGTKVRFILTKQE